MYIIQKIWAHRWGMFVTFEQTNTNIDWRGIQENIYNVQLKS